MKPSYQMSRYVIGKIAILLILALSVLQIQGAGIHGKDPTGTSDPSNIDSDDDGLPDTEDAVPDDPEINWLKSSESRYVWIEQMTTPKSWGGRLIPPVAVNSSGQILFPYYTVGEWDPSTETQKNHLWDSAERQWADLPHTGSQAIEIEAGLTFTATDRAGGFIDINDAGTVSAFARGGDSSPHSPTPGAHEIARTQSAMIWEKSGTPPAYGPPKYFIYHPDHPRYPYTPPFHNTTYRDNCFCELDLSNWTHGGILYHWGNWRAPGGRIGIDGSMNLCAHISGRNYKLSPVWLLRDGTSASPLLDQKIKQLADNQVNYLSQANYNGTFPGAILDKNHALFVETLSDTNTSNVWLKDGEDVTTIASVTPPLDNYDNHDNHDTDMIFAPSTKDDNTERLWIAAGNKILLEKRAGGAGSGRWHNPPSMAEGATRLNARGEAIIPGKPAAAAPTHPKLWRNGLYIDLNEVATKPDTVTITKAIDLASNGIILAQATENGVDKTGLLVPLDLAVDADRDGEVTFDGKDKTTAEKPYRFWINNDQDDVEADEPVTVDQNERDLLDSTIKTSRDLEDFTRVKIKVGIPLQQLQEGKFKVGLKFKNSTSTGPVVRIWPNESDVGSRDYLTDGIAAVRQRSKTCIGDTYTETAFIPKSYWLGRSDSEAHLIFEGARKGVGQLVLMIKPENASEVESASIHLNLLDVREIYQRARIINEPEAIHASMG